MRVVLVEVLMTYCGWLWVGVLAVALDDILAFLVLQLLSLTLTLPLLRQTQPAIVNISPASDARNTNVNVNKKVTFLHCCYIFAINNICISALITHSQMQCKDLSALETAVIKVRLYNTTVNTYSVLTWCVGERFSSIDLPVVLVRCCLMLSETSITIN